MARLKGFQKLTPVDAALDAFMKAVKTKRPKAVTVSLDSALNRVLAEPVCATENLPRVNRSTMDGYAVRAGDTVGTSQFKPQTMTLTDKSHVGENEAKQVWTGTPVPEGADSVVMLENTKRVGKKIEVWTPLTPGENVSKKGEDIKKGDTALEPGIRLKPQHLALAAALGLVRLKVFEAPKIAVLATGNEIVEIGSKPKEGQVFDVNRHALSALCRELGAEPVDLGIVGDDTARIMESLRAAGLVADAVITTGGTSVGFSDLVPDVVKEMGNPGIIVHGVAMRPAMPTALAVLDGKPVLIFPGNPVAAMIAFEVFARPLICRMLGLKHEEHRPVVKALMTRKMATTLGRKTYVRVCVFQRGGCFFAEPISARGSGIVSTMTRSNGYVVASEDREGLDKGEEVSVNLFDSIEVDDRHVPKTPDA